MTIVLRHTPIALALALMGQAAMAAPPILAPTVVITGTRVEQNSFDLPMAIDSIDAATIQEQRATVNLSEVINRVPGVASAGKENYTQEQSLTIRGFGARSAFGVRGVKLLADGIPASTPDGQGGTGLFDLASASRIEVLRGPFSALYGNHSGGVVQVFTEDGPENFTITPSFQAGSYGTTRYGLKFGDTVGNFNYTASVSDFRTDGYRDYSKSEKQQANFKARVQLSDNATLTMVGNYLHQQGQDPLGLTLAQMNQDRRQVGLGGSNLTASEFRARRTLENTQGGAVLDARLSDIDSLRVALFVGNRNNEQYLALNTGTQAPPRSSGGLSTFDRDYWGVNVRWTRKLEKLTFSVGAEYERADEKRLGYENFVAGPIYGVKGRLRRDEVNTAEQSGVFTQGEYALTKDFSLMGGLRYTRVDFKSNDNYIVGVNVDDSGSTHHGAWTSAFGGVWKISPKTNIYANVGRSFEAPTLAELAYRQVITDAGLNLDLKASKSTQYEVGIKSYVTESTRVDAAAFYIDTENEIVTATNTGGRVSYQNAGDTSRKGLEFTVDSRINNSFSGFATLTLLDAKFDDAFLTCAVSQCPNVNPAVPVASGNKLASVANKNFFGELTWRHAASGFLGGIEYRASGRMYADDTNNARVGGYGVASIRGGFTQTSGNWKFNQFARIDNLFDKEYVGSIYINEGNQRYYAPAAERTWLIGLSASYSM
ncbi:MAG: TonB-dependent receptor [Methyloversatilis sp.]|jgi:iron complex outermembrane receptor protein|nr:TonB-dependent receptor [Methyloversatilis sp.]